MSDQYTNKPEIMYDCDGMPMAVILSEEIDTPTKALRMLLEEHPEQAENLEGHWVEPEEERWRPKLSVYRKWVESITRVFYRPAEEGDWEIECSEFGGEGWFRMGKPDARAVAYWEVQEW